MSETGTKKRDWRWPENASENLVLAVCPIVGKRRWLFQANDAEELGLTFLVSAEGLAKLRTATKKARKILLDQAFYEGAPKKVMIEAAKPELEVPVEAPKKATKPRKKKGATPAAELIAEIRAEVVSIEEGKKKARTDIEKSKKGRERKAKKDQAKADHAVRSSFEAFLDGE